MKKSNLQFTNERGIPFQLEKTIKKPNGKVERFSGWIEVGSQKYEALWDVDGTCIFVNGNPTLNGNPLESQVFNIISEVPFTESDYPKNIESRYGQWFRINSVVYDFTSTPIRLHGEYKSNNVNKPCVWGGNGTSQIKSDLDLVLIEPYKE